MIINEILTLPVNESSGYSLAGSFTHDLIKSKVWLLHELSHISHQFDTVYILGSWYGNLALYMHLDPVVHAKKIINVENNQKFLEASRRILDSQGIDNVEYMLKDSNNIDYQQLSKHGVVVNTSLTDMPGIDWFEHIPEGTMVVMQARDHDPGQQYHSTDNMIQRFPLTKTLYEGKLQLQDPETVYTRYMVIGIK